MDSGLSKEHQQLVERVDELVRERFVPRAARYDERYEAPWEDIQDLHKEGWLLSNLRKEYGGLGYGTDGDDPLPFFRLIERLARGNPSTAHCFQVHNNTVQMISGMATPEQRERWLEPTIERGALLVGVGGEPPGAPPTTVYPVEGSFRVRGASTTRPTRRWPNGCGSRRGSRMRRAGSW